MDKVYHIELDDYSMPAFVSFGKNYYGTMADIEEFISKFEDDEDNEVVKAFQEYKGGTKEFLDGIINYFPQFFTGSKIKNKRSISNTYSISCACDKADKLATILYENATIYLDRKYNRFAVLRRNS